MERCGILSGDLSRTNPGGEKVVVCVCVFRIFFVEFLLEFIGFNGWYTHWFMEILRFSHPKKG